MKTVKIKFVGFWPGFDPETFFITEILQKHYKVMITEENADYVICSGSGFYEYLGCDQIRIMFSGEPYIPDFNYIDYAFSVYPVEFADRHFSFPGLVLSSYDYLLEVSQKDRNYTEEILKEKPYFANMIASHESEKGLRKQFLETAEKYKRVEAAGLLYNNMPNGEKVQMRDGTKLALQKKCKFTFCGESLAHEGFITEKIFDAFNADTIPIYYGSKMTSDLINKNAFIDVNDYDSMDAVLKRIIELDQDDEQYLQMLRQPVFNEPNYIEDKIVQLEAFICHIFDQPVEAAYRRCRMYMPQVYEDELIKCKNVRRIQSLSWAKNISLTVKKFGWAVFEFLLPIKRAFIPSKMDRKK